MIFLRGIRILLLMGGLALLGLTAKEGARIEEKGSQFFENWRCEVSDTDQGVSNCVSEGRWFYKTQLVSLGITGVGLIGASIAIGQFDRGLPPPRYPQPAYGAGPMPPPMQQPGPSGF